MGREKKMSWLEEREKEYKEVKKMEIGLANRIVDLDREIKENKEERDCWQRYITWIEKNPDMEDPDVAIKACKTMQKELADNYNCLIQELQERRSKLKRITTLGNFVKWVKSGKAEKS